MEVNDEEGAQGAEDVEEVACCFRPLEARYNVPNRECSGGEKCRIPPNSDYMRLIKPSRIGKEYCIYCFAKNARIQKTLYMKKKNQHEKFEQVLRYQKCPGLIVF
ncbi:hypothetical protein B9Z55_022881 [Caenorhabditis nigoni]|uniref:Uncharacterized protein n=1 Tax=Caenorhabditis nigoni TaxID=1611254 RepID=A0A2G5SMA8_9PELO|nr:hypothetical protein B9Z55_022881 [Caenorhabditis nigoni]